MADSRIQVAIKLNDLTKTYGSSRGVEKLNLTVQKGEVFGSGPNGAGKSTAINTMLDFLRPTSGSVTILNKDANANSTEIHKDIGYLSGDMETDLSLTGAQYLDYVANLRGLTDLTYKNELIERLQCNTTKKIKHLSRGNRQKIGLVAALMHDPEVLILDEPTTGLDPLIQSEFNAIIKEHQQRGKTTFMSSHVLSEVQATCDRVGFIRNGELIEVRNLQELILNAPRIVEVVFKKDSPDTRLNKLSGVSNFVATGTRRTFDYRGDYNELLQVLLTKPIASIQITEPALDDLFMGMYKGEEMFNTILTKTLYSLRWQYTGWLIAIFFTVFITMVMYPSFSQTGIEEIINSVPEALRSFVGSVSDFNTIPGYIGQQIFGPNLYIISIIMAIVIFIAISVSEEADGRLQSLLALPVSRTRVYLEKYLAAALVVTAISLSVIAAIWVSLLLINESASFGRVWESAVGFTILNLAYGTIAFVVAMATGSKGITLLIASGYAVASLFISSLAPAVDKLSFIDKFSLIHYYNNPQTMTNGLSAPDIGLQIAVIIVVLLIGIVAFNRRDVRAT